MEILKTPTIGLLVILALLVFSLFTTQAKAEFFATGGVYATNPSTDKCTGTCNFTVKTATEPAVSFGYYFKNPIVDLGVEITSGDVDLYLINLRKRFGRWAIEAGAGHFEQDFKFNFGAAPAGTQTSVVSGRDGSSKVVMAGVNYSLGKKKNHTIFGRYLYSQMDLNITRANYKLHHGRSRLISSESSKIDLDNSTVWVGYRFSF